ncbi:MAG: T9SS type A sorting domain-containing protein [Flavobacteriales bacterium]
MKKIYLLAFSLVAAVGANAQTQQVTAQKKQFTRDEITPTSIVMRQDRIQDASILRTVIFEEDFQAVTGTLPQPLPALWSTPIVTTIIDDFDEPDEPIIDVSSFTVQNSETAVAGGYWPVPEYGGSNQFAGANDDADPCNCANADTYLQTPVIDFSDATNPALIFDIFHDQGFGGGAAIAQISTNGTDWVDMVYSGSDDGTLPVDESVWQTCIFLLFEYAGESTVSIRFHWTDNDTWASGFAVDNVEVGDLEANNMALNKVVFGNWYMEDFIEGFWDYTMIPVSQTSEIQATAIVANNGLNDQTGVTFNLEVSMNGTEVSGSPFVSDQTADTPSLQKDTLSVLTPYIPGELGEVSIECSVVSTVTDDDPTDDSSTKSLMITAETYARDADAAQAFVLIANEEIYGNLFGMHANEFFGGIDVAVGGGTDEGTIIQGQLFYFDGLDEDGLPVLSDVDDSFTVQHIVTADDLNGVGENNFITLGFEDGAQELEADVTYMACIINLDGGDLRIPVSGPNNWPASWIYSGGEWGWTGSVPMIRLNGDPNVSVKENETVANTVTVDQNMPNPANGITVINYNLPAAEVVTITVRDMTGRTVKVMNLGKQTPGAQRYELNVSDLSAGSYTYTLVAGEVAATKEMIVK